MRKPNQIKVGFHTQPLTGISSGYGKISDGVRPPSPSFDTHRTKTSSHTRVGTWFWQVSHRVANIARREEKVAASSFRVLSSFLNFIMVSVTIAFSFSYLLFRLARATSAVCRQQQCRTTLARWATKEDDELII